MLQWRNGGRAEGGSCSRAQQPRGAKRREEKIREIFRETQTVVFAMCITTKIVIWPVPN